MQHWIVIHTHPQAERWATQNLTRAGYFTYLPLLASRRRDTVGNLRVRLAPLFPRYLFLQLDPRDPWTPIRYAPGVARLVMANGSPQYARAGAVDALQATEDVRRSLPAQNSLWAPGMPCSPGKGHVLAGHRAIVLSVQRETVRVALMMFGALREVSLPANCLVLCDE